MGMYHSAYYAYGVRIPDTRGDVLENVLQDLNGVGPRTGDEVGYLHAGAYDREMTFLVTRSKKVDLGEFATVDPQAVTAETYAQWDTELRAAAAAVAAAGRDEDDDPTADDQAAAALTPGWLIVPDCS